MIESEKNKADRLKSRAHTAALTHNYTFALADKPLYLSYLHTVEPRNNGSEGTDCILLLLLKSAIAKMIRVRVEEKHVIILIQRGQCQSKRLQRVLSHCLNHPDDMLFCHHYTCKVQNQI